jgi:hypothetical protein
MMRRVHECMIAIDAHLGNSKMVFPYMLHYRGQCSRIGRFAHALHHTSTPHACRMCRLMEVDIPGHLISTQALSCGQRCVRSLTCTARCQVPLRLGLRSHSLTALQRLSNMLRSMCIYAHRVASCMATMVWILMSWAGWLLLQLNSFAARLVILLVARRLFARPGICASSTRNMWP